MAEGAHEALLCPEHECRSLTPVSTEDPDSSLDDVLRHLRQHHLLFPDEALRRLAEVGRAQRRMPSRSLAVAETMLAVETVDNQECAYVHRSSESWPCLRPAVLCVEEPDRDDAVMVCADCAEDLRLELEAVPTAGYRIRTIRPSDLVTAGGCG